MAARLAWIFDDPRGEDVPEEETLDRFREIRDEVEVKIKGWLEYPEEELKKLKADRERERLERLEAARRDAEARDAARVGEEAAEARELHARPTYA